MKSSIKSIELYLHENPEKRCDECYQVLELCKSMKKHFKKENIKFNVEKDDSFEQVFLLEKKLPVLRRIEGVSVKHYSGFPAIKDFASEYLNN